MYFNVHYTGTHTNFQLPNKHISFLHFQMYRSFNRKHYFLNNGRSKKEY